MSSELSFDDVVSMLEELVYLPHVGTDEAPTLELSYEEDNNQSVLHRLTLESSILETPRSSFEFDLKEFDHKEPHGGIIDKDSFRMLNCSTATFREMLDCPTAAFPEMCPTAAFREMPELDIGPSMSKRSRRRVPNSYSGSRKKRKTGKAYRKWSFFYKKN